MRELKVIGLDVDGKHVICEGRDPSDKFSVRVDDRLRAALRGDRSRLGQIPMDTEVKGALRPKDIQARIRAGASVEEVATSSGMDVSKVERFAHPVLLERSRAAELATAAHPVLADGPAVNTLGETVATTLANRGLASSATTWDSWRNEDGRWTVQIAWRAGLSENVAHFRFSPGSHGGTVIALDDSATELIDPTFERQLRPVPPVVQIETAQFEAPRIETQAPAPAQPEEPVAEEKPERTSTKRSHPAVPAWEDVLLGVRSTGRAN
jgi:hypothetical protein